MELGSENFTKLTAKQGVCREQKWWLGLLKPCKIREEDGGSKIESRETERLGIAVSF